MSQSRPPEHHLPLPDDTSRESSEQPLVDADQLILDLIDALALEGILTSEQLPPEWVEYCNAQGVFIPSEKDSVPAETIEIAAKSTADVSPSPEQRRKPRNPMRRLRQWVAIGLISASIASGAAKAVQLQKENKLMPGLKATVKDTWRKLLLNTYPNDLQKQSLLTQWANRIDDKKVTDWKGHFNTLTEIIKETSPEKTKALIQEISATWWREDVQRQLTTESTTYVQNAERTANLFPQTNAIDRSTYITGTYSLDIFTPGNYGISGDSYPEGLYVNFLESDKGKSLRSQVNQTINEFFTSTSLADTPALRGQLEYLLYNMWFWESIAPLANQHVDKLNQSGMPLLLSLRDFRRVLQSLNTDAEKIPVTFSREALPQTFQLLDLLKKSGKSTDDSQAPKNTHEQFFVLKQTAFLLGTLNDKPEHIVAVVANIAKYHIPKEEGWVQPEKRDGWESTRAFFADPNLVKELTRITASEPLYVLTNSDGPNFRKERGNDALIRYAILDSDLRQTLQEKMGWAPSRDSQAVVTAIKLLAHEPLPILLGPRLPNTSLPVEAVVRYLVPIFQERKMSASDARNFLEAVRHFMPRDYEKRSPTEIEALFKKTFTDLLQQSDKLPTQLPSELRIHLLRIKLAYGIPDAIFYKVVPSELQELVALGLDDTAAVEFLQSMLDRMSNFGEKDVAFTEDNFSPYIQMARNIMTQVRSVTNNQAEAMRYFRFLSGRALSSMGMPSEKILPVVAKTISAQGGAASLSQEAFSFVLSGLFQQTEQFAKSHFWSVIEQRSDIPPEHRMFLVGLNNILKSPEKTMPLYDRLRAKNSRLFTAPILLQAFSRIEERKLFPEEKREEAVGFLLNALEQSNASYFLAESDYKDGDFGQLLDTLIARISDAYVIEQLSALPGITSLESESGRFGVAGEVKSLNITESPSADSLSLPQRTFAFDPFFIDDIVVWKDNKLSTSNGFTKDEAETLSKEAISKLPSERMQQIFSRKTFLVIRDYRPADVIVFPEGGSEIRQLFSSLIEGDPSVQLVRVNTATAANGEPLRTVDAFYQDDNQRPLLVIGKTAEGGTKAYFVIVKEGVNLPQVWKTLLHSLHLNSAQVVMYDRGTAFAMNPFADKEMKTPYGFQKHFFAFGSLSGTTETASSP